MLAARCSHCAGIPSCRSSNRPVFAQLGGPAGGGDRPGGRRGGRSRKAKLPGLYEVEDVSPPRQSLGIHALPPNTHNGDQIEVSGGSYVVQSVVLQYKFVRGRYRQEHRRLEVAKTGRFLYNKFLEEVYQIDIN